MQSMVCLVSGSHYIRNDGQYSETLIDDEVFTGIWREVSESLDFFGGWTDQIMFTLICHVCLTIVVGFKTYHRALSLRTCNPDTLFIESPIYPFFFPFLFFLSWMAQVHCSRKQWPTQMHLVKRRLWMHLLHTYVQQTRMPAGTYFYPLPCRLFSRIRMARA